jgi:signal recognition particle receptor subunit alpha
MRALAKLIAVNDPDLVLFVGEALVGNEAVDQVTIMETNSELIFFTNCSVGNASKLEMVTHN